MVKLARMGYEDREQPRHGAGARRCRASSPSCCTGCGATKPRSALASSRRSSIWRRYEGIDEALTHRRFARKVKQIVPVGTKGKMISLTAKNLPVESPTRSFNRLRRLALLTPSCGGLAPAAKRSAYPRERDVRQSGRPNRNSLTSPNPIREACYAAFEENP